MNDASELGSSTDRRDYSDKLVLRMGAPDDDGSCPITGNVLYLDGGDTNTCFNPVDEDEMADKDYLRSHTVNFDVTELSKTFRFIMEAVNEIGSV